MNSALWKDNLREIKESIPRFISIFAIIALGVSFFVGIRAAGPSMVRTAREVYQENNMPDGHILSTVGLNETEIDLLDTRMVSLSYPCSPLMLLSVLVKKTRRYSPITVMRVQISSRFLKDEWLKIRMRLSSIQNI